MSNEKITKITEIEVVESFQRMLVSSDGTTNYSSLLRSSTSRSTSSVPFGSTSSVPSSTSYEEFQRRSTISSGSKLYESSSRSSSFSLPTSSSLSSSSSSSFHSFIDKMLEQLEKCDQKTKDVVEHKLDLLLEVNTDSERRTICEEILECLQNPQQQRLPYVQPSLQERNTKSTSTVNTRQPTLRQESGKRFVKALKKRQEKKFGRSARTPNNNYNKSRTIENGTNFCWLAVVLGVLSKIPNFNVKLNTLFDIDLSSKWNTTMYRKIHNFLVTRHRINSDTTKSNNQGNPFQIVNFLQNKYPDDFKFDRFSSDDINDIGEKLLTLKNVVGIIYHTGEIRNSNMNVSQSVSHWKAFIAEENDNYSSFDSLKGGYISYERNQLDDVCKILLNKDIIIIYK